MLDETARKRTFDHAMELWFAPEIQRRKEAGKLPDSFSLKAAQVLIHPDARPSEIRLNEEVEAIGQVKFKDGIIKNEGDPVYASDLDGSLTISLPDTTDRNCGHFTLICIADKWYASFDFRYNKHHAKELLNAAEEFLETGSSALSTGRLRPAIDNLFSAIELAAKAHVITTPTSNDPIDIKSHNQIHQQFNFLAHRGEIDSRYRKTFNALSNSRANARYVRGPLKETSQTIMEWKSEIANLISYVRERKT